MKTFDLVLHSDYPPDVCLAKLREQVDEERITIFSFSGYQGTKPILGRIAGHEFRLHKRRYWHNSFGPVLYGRVLPDGRGTRVEAYWNMRRLTRVFMRVWTILAAVLGTPVFVTTLLALMKGTDSAKDDQWLGLVVPPLLVLWGIVLPRIGAGLSFHERKHVVALLERALVAQAKLEKRLRDWNSSLW